MLNRPLKVRLGVLLFSLIWANAADHSLAREPEPAAITVDYPQNETIFPPEFPPPTFIWHDLSEASTIWLIELKFAHGSSSLKTTSQGEGLSIGEIDERCISPTNKLPELTEEQATAHSWVPDSQLWEKVKRSSTKRPVTMTITGFSDQRMRKRTSLGRVSFRTSEDPVGAPIFYRDVPLMPSATEKGVIKPLAQHAVPLIAWRLRDVGQPKSRVIMEGLHTCTNCHSASADGKTMAMDVDGPANDKGLYAIFPIKSHSSIRNEDVIAWSSHEGKLGGKLRVGFMSQLSPDGQYVVTTINDPGKPQTEAERRRAPQDLIGNYYVANFKDYRFLQVFYATKGILAWYSRETGRLQPLPGADDPRYVHANATWSRDGKYLVFVRAEARDSYPPGSTLAEFANDPNETQIQYDLCRIPFNDGKGGVAEPIAGASENGMSNSFPKISPDGRWIVFVQSRNGLLMRPDSRLFIVPVEGGTARLMNCNTPRMHSWHSFSPNGRWLVFSSKSRSPYTQMFLTHIDENGQDSPPILIENSTAANRAVNIPEFLNIAPESLVSIDAPATEFYRLFDVGVALAEKGEHDAAISEWRRALDMSQGDARVHNNIGVSLAALGRYPEAITMYEKALSVDEAYSDAYTNWGLALARTGKLDEAILKLRMAIDLNPRDAGALSNLAAAFLDRGRVEEAIWSCEKALNINPDDSDARANLAVALAMSGRAAEAIPHFELALARRPDSAEIHYNLGFALLQTGQPDKAIPHLEKALAADPGSADLHFHLGNSLHSVGRDEEALNHWREAIRINPSDPAILDHAARLLAASPDASIRNGAQAIALADRAVRLSGGKDAAILDTLAVALAETGEFDRAVEIERRALELATEAHDQALAEELSSRIELFESENPYREQ